MQQIAWRSNKAYHPIIVSTSCHMTAQFQIHKSSHPVQPRSLQEAKLVQTDAIMLKLSSLDGALYTEDIDTLLMVVCQQYLWK